MSNNQPETKQQFEFTSAPEGLPPLRLRLAVGGIATVVALTEFGAAKPARATHEPEADEIMDCLYGSHAVPFVDTNNNGQLEIPSDWICVIRPECAYIEPPLFIPADTWLTPEQSSEIVSTNPIWCRGDPEYNFDSWFEAHPWAIPYRADQPTEDTTPEEEVVNEQQPDTGTTTTTETEPDQPEPVVEPVSEPETTEDTTPEEEVVNEQQPDTGTTTTTETEPDQPEPVVEPVSEPETTEDTTPEEEVVNEQQPDTGTTTTETEPDQPEPVVEPTEPETISAQL